MKTNVKFSLLISWIFLISLLMSGCSSLIAKYDKIAYQQATSLKVDSLNLMGKAIRNYSEHESDVEELNAEIDKAYEYAKGRPRNEIIIKQWSIMKDPDRSLLGGFLVRWKEEGSLTEAFVTEAKVNVSLGFDQIIGLESGLIKPRD